MALVTHVTYLTREIVPFLKKLEEVVPGHVELVNVLWELGILPDVHVLQPADATPLVPAPTREAAIAGAMGRFRGDQWTFWPLGAELEHRFRGLWETRFDELFATGHDGFSPRWITPGREILITWQPTTGSV